jgi:hypothetical protein
MKKQVLTLVAIFIASITLAQTNGLNYKALITNNGNVLNAQNVTFKFTVLQNGTTSVYQETQDATTDANGIAAVNIGEGNVVSGNFSSIDWGADEYFLKVEIDTGSGFTDFGTTEFKYVPYAKYAEKAGNVFSGDFNDLTNVPTGLSDGDDDTQLTEAQVDAYVSNNGYLTSETDGSTTNELQNLSLTGNQLSISNGNQVTFTNWDTNVNDDFSGDYNDLTNQPDVFRIDGTTNPATSYTDDIKHAGEMFLGEPFASTGAGISQLRIQRRKDNSDLDGIAIAVSGSGTGEHKGLDIGLTGDASDSQYGIANNILNSGDGLHYGNYSYLNGSGSGRHYGTHNHLSGTGTGEQCGSYNEINNSGDANHFGNVSKLSGSGSGSHYGACNVLFGTGTGDQYAVYNDISNSGDANHYGVFNNLTGSGSGVHTAVNNRLTGTGSGTRIGVNNYIFHSGTGTYFGVKNILGGAGAGSQFGTSNFISNSSNGNHYGIRNSLIGQGTGDKYGSYNNISSTAGGKHYAVYAEATKDAADVYAGYFVGDVNVKTGNLNVEDKLTAPTSGDADMKAYIYGKIYSNSIVSSASSSGFTLTRVSAGLYRIYFATPFSSLNSYIGIASLYSNSGFIYTQNTTDYLEIKTFDTTGTLQDKHFTFVVYKK